jgi:hypothetical protein
MAFRDFVTGHRHSIGQRRALRPNSTATKLPRQAICGLIACGLQDLVLVREPLADEIPIHHVE